MPKKVKAIIGDSLCNIAFKNGFGDCKPLREEPANAFIVNRADDPGQVLPGDIVTVPDFIEHSENKATENKHKFVKRDNFAILRFVHGSKDASVRNDRTLTFLNVSNYITNQAGVPDGNVPFPGSAIRDFNADADKDIDAFKVEVLDIDATADLTVELEVLRPIYNAAGTVTGHTRFPDAIRPDRRLSPDASKQGTTQRFRTCYLRLVVDDADKGIAADSFSKQTLLASDMHDNGDSKVEILDQKVKASYTIAKCPQTPKCKSTVILPIGEDRRRMRLALHVLNNKPKAEGGTPVIDLPIAEGRIWKWFRRVYAQANIAPKLSQATRAIDPPENLVSISNDSGLSAAGPTASGSGRLGFTIKAAGKVSQVIGPIITKKGDTPKKTAEALAKLIKTPYKAVVSVNPARSIDPVGSKSADIVITEDSKERVTIDDPPISEDDRQTLTVGRADATNLEATFVPIANANGNVGTLQERTIAKNHDTGDDRIDIFVVVKLSDGARGEALLSGHRVDPLRASISKLKYSAFLSVAAMDATNALPFTFPHELGHAAGEVGHTPNGVNPSQMMADGGTSKTNVIGGTKRIRDGAVNYDSPAGDFNLVRRLRTEGKPLLESW